MQAYHACISFLDAQLSIVFDALKSSGHWEDTIVIFTSDHGYHLGEHFLWGKVTLFDIGTRVPFLVRVPGLTKGGTESEAMVELVDVYPTLVDLAGLDPPSGLQGVSLRPLLNHPERRGKKKGCLLCCDSRTKVRVCHPQSELAIQQVARWRGALQSQ